MKFAIFNIFLYMLLSITIIRGICWSLCGVSMAYIEKVIDAIFVSEFICPHFCDRTAAVYFTRCGYPYDSIIAIIGSFMLNG